MTGTGLAVGLLLTIEALPDDRWSLSCEQGRGAARVSVELRGQGGLERELAVGPVHCRIVLEAGRALRVTLVDGRGNVSRAAASGAGATVRLRGG